MKEIMAIINISMKKKKNVKMKKKISKESENEMAKKMKKI